MISTRISRSGFNTMSCMYHFSLGLNSSMLIAFQVLLSTWSRLCFMLPTHHSCLATYCANHQGYVPCLGLLGFPNGTLLQQCCSQHQESIVPLHKHQQIYHIMCTVNPYHSPIQLKWETMSSTTCISWPKFDAGFMYVFHALIILWIYISFRSAICSYSSNVIHCIYQKLSVNESYHIACNSIWCKFM